MPHKSRRSLTQRGPVLPSSRTPRQLPEPMLAYRIGDAKGIYPVVSGDGAYASDDGRWHTSGQNVIYASRHLSTAMLEKLVHCSGEMPRNQHFATITIPAGVSYEVVDKDQLPGWHKPNKVKARKFGSKWFTDERSAILIVPSVVARTEENVVINPNHLDFKVRVFKSTLERYLSWDKRLFTHGTRSGAK